MKKNDSKYIFVNRGIGINDAQKEDAGTYVCEGASLSRRAYTRSSLLSVTGEVETINILSPFIPMNHMS